ncbi:MAG: rhodanese-like domain-containing protein [Thioalkalispiraceae bacterium]|jgi:rhodanese-related sulfurtransferase
MPKKLLTVMVFVFLNTLLLSNAIAVDTSKVAKNKQNSLGLYMSSNEVHAYMSSQGNKALFLDIRDPVEIHTVGMPAGVDYNVAFKFIDTSKWDKKKSKFKLVSNPDYKKDVAARLNAKGLSKDDRIILICGSGKRAAKAVNALAKAGYKNVYSVVDGYKGWQKNKLPFEKKLDRKKIYGNPA